MRGVRRQGQAKATEQQTQQNIESSFAYAEDHIRKNYDGDVEFRCLGEQTSGLILNRRTILEAMELIETGEWDVVIAEDLSRIYRNPGHQYGFVHDCVDANIRLICVADLIDTADDNWETMLAAATLRHGLHIPDTRRRVKHNAKDAFHDGVPYILAVNSQFDPMIASVSNLPPEVGDKLQVIGEQRTTEIQNSAFRDRFQPYEVHLYAPAS